MIISVSREKYMTTVATRRRFIGGALALSAFGSGCLSVPFTGRRWYKGNLHMHTYWSDGRAFPEEAIMWYRRRGYDFLGLSDHNVFQDDTDRWVSVADPEKKLPGVKKDIAETYLKEFPDAITRRGKDGRLQIRLKTFAELSERYAEAGKFLLIPDVEATRTTFLGNGRKHQLHMNYVNLPELLPSYARPGFSRKVKSRPVSEFLGDTVRETAELAERMGRRHVFILNHPIWTWYDVGPEALIDNPSVRFFELCNNGSPFAPGDGLPDDGFDTDRLWDVVNAFRARRNQPLLYGVGTDDTHYYRGEHGKMLMPGNAWSLVRADALETGALIDAMYEGDFVTCEMLEPEDVVFDKSAGRLEVTVGAGSATTRTVKFIVTKRDFSEKPIRTLTVRPKEKRGFVDFERTINIYDEKIGLVVKTVKSRVGEPLTASYTLQDDDLYVRARIEESGQPLCTAYLHPQGKRVAWTQPYMRDSHG